MYYNEFGIKRLQERIAEQGEGGMTEKERREILAEKARKARDGYTEPFALAPDFIIILAAACGIMALLMGTS